MAEISSTLKELYAKREPLVQQAETLSTRTSSLAQKLLEKVQENLEDVNKNIAEAEKRQAEVKKEIEDNQQSISQREDDATLYINEQSSIIVSTFLEYMGNHLEEFGNEITKTFKIKESTFRDSCKYNGCTVPTGDLGIYDENQRTFIVYSRDFYFKQNLFKITRDDFYPKMICKHSEWYKTYRNQFVSHILETLEKNYTYGEFFKLTIGDSRFTLELV